MYRLDVLIQGILTGALSVTEQAIQMFTAHVNVEEILCRKADAAGRVAVLCVVVALLLPTKTAPEIELTMLPLNMSL